MLVVLPPQRQQPAATAAVAPVAADAAAAAAAANSDSLVAASDALNAIQQSDFSEQAPEPIPSIWNPTCTNRVLTRSLFQDGTSKGTSHDWGVSQF